MCAVKIVGTVLNTQREYSELSDRVRATMHHLPWGEGGRDGTIASRSINRENNIEVLVIFKKIQFALGSPTRYECYSGTKKMSDSGKSEQEHVTHLPHKT